MRRDTWKVNVIIFNKEKASQGSLPGPPQALVPSSSAQQRTGNCSTTAVLHRRTYAMTPLTRPSTIEVWPQWPDYDAFCTSFCLLVFSQRTSSDWWRMTHPCTSGGTHARPQVPDSRHWFVNLCATNRRKNKCRRRIVASKWKLGETVREPWHGRESREVRK